jgi:hypothetical protein
MTKFFVQIPFYFAIFVFSLSEQNCFAARCRRSFAVGVLMPHPSHSFGKGL